MNTKAHKPTIITIANQKGGVGKTTTAVNIAYAMQMIFGKKILLIDMDAQGNATTSLAIDKNSLALTITDVLLGDCAINEAIIHAECGLDVIGANRELSGLDIVLSATANPQTALKEALNTPLDYDYIVIDLAPSLSLVSVNALMATDGVIIPMQCEYYALEGVADLIYTIEKLQAANPNLSVRGVVRTMYDPRNTLAHDVSHELTRHFGQLMYRTAIPRNVRLAEAPSFGRTIFEHYKSSKGAIAYQKLTEEILAQDNPPPLCGQ